MEKYVGGRKKSDADLDIRLLSRHEQIIFCSLTMKTSYLNRRLLGCDSSDLYFSISTPCTGFSVDVEGACPPVPDTVRQGCSSITNLADRASVGLFWMSESVDVIDLDLVDIAVGDAVPGEDGCGVAGQ